MEVPHFWRLKGQMLNPNVNGYRPGILPPILVSQENTFARITNPSYYRHSEDQNVRDVINYSEMLKPEISVEQVSPTTKVEVESKVAEKPTEIVIYQSDSVMAEV